MSSDRQAAANRENSRHSRGPTTTAGKTRSRANALRHGLAASVLTPPALRHEVEALAQAIAGNDADPWRLALANEIAAAQIDWMRVQALKVALMNSQLATNISERSQDALPDALRDVLPDETTAPQNLVLVPSIDTFQQLARLERHERRAIARHRRAARRFITSTRT
jgi:hypothetical protein